MSEDYPERPDIPDTFRLEFGGEAIRCLHCGFTSWNAKDVEERYCGRCHVFHHDIWPPARQHWIQSGHFSE